MAGREDSERFLLQIARTGLGKVPGATGGQQMAWPNREFETGRNLRRSPLHERLAAQGACFGVKNGWERPNWFARPSPSPLNRENAGVRGENLQMLPFATKPETNYSFGRQNWFPNHAAEHRAARENVALFDQTGFSKFIFKGPAAVNVLQRLCGNDVDVPIGHAVYTGMLNDRGGFESDLTLIRLALGEYFIVTGSSQT